MENKVDEIVDEIINHEQTKDRVNGMRKKADLTDIILEKEQSSISSAQKKKKLLLAVASLVLLFLIFLIISKMINSDSSTKEKVVKQQPLSEQKIKLSDNDKKEQPKTNEENSKKITPNDETDLKFKELVKKLREQDAKENTNVVASNQNDSLTPQVTTPSKNVEVKKPAETKKESKITITSSKPEVSKKPKISSKPEVHKSTKTTKHPVRTTSSKSAYYIQVGATAKPYINQALRSKIKSGGFSYTTHPVFVKGRKFYKILIGPYNSKAAALQNIGSVKTIVNPGAYIFYLRK